jgi:hypothetical protein
VSSRGIPALTVSSALTGAVGRKMVIRWLLICRTVEKRCAPPVVAGATMSGRSPPGLDIPSIRRPNIFETVGVPVTTLSGLLRVRHQALILKRHFPNGTDSWATTAIERLALLPK